VARRHTISRRTPTFQAGRRFLAIRLLGLARRAGRMFSTARHCVGGRAKIDTGKPPILPGYSQNETRRSLLDHDGDRASPSSL
jgi:hypothetical protein